MARTTAEMNTFQTRLIVRTPVIQNCSLFPAQRSQISLAMVPVWNGCLSVTTVTVCRIGGDVTGSTIVGKVTSQTRLAAVCPKRARLCPNIARPYRASVARMTLLALMVSRLKVILRSCRAF